MAFGQPPSQGSSSRELMGFRNNVLISGAGAITYGMVVKWDSSLTTFPDSNRYISITTADPLNPTAFNTGGEAHIDFAWASAFVTEPRGLSIGINFTRMEDDRLDLSTPPTTVRVGPPGDPYPTIRDTIGPYLPQMPGPGGGGLALMYGYCPTLRVYSGNANGPAVDIKTGTTNTRGTPLNKAFMQLRLPLISPADAAGQARLVPLNPTGLSDDGVGETTNSSATDTNLIQRAGATLAISLEPARYDQIGNGEAFYGVCAAFVKVPF